LTNAFRGDAFAQLLQSQRLWPVDPAVEQNWSGLGQHVSFEEHEQRLINEILEYRNLLGSTRTAVVQSVKCRRILLARKSIICSKRTITRQDAIAEVAHLTRLNHGHILRVIGTYVKGSELSILLYPVAKYNLEVFLEEVRTGSWRVISFEDLFTDDPFYGCLSSAVHYIHRSLTKHMDLKPQNILIVETSTDPYIKPFIADFGIARSYESTEEMETDGWTSFTRQYAAPEVVLQDFRGLPADIFSLGCVFLEILDAVYLSHSLSHRSWRQKVLDANPQGDPSYQANVDALQTNLESNAFGLPSDYIFSKVEIMTRMLELNPRDRPTAEDLVSIFGENVCCLDGAVKLEAVFENA
jgi:serine/threonine protein kinase